MSSGDLDERQPIQAPDATLISKLIREIINQGKWSAKLEQQLGELRQRVDKLENQKIGPKLRGWGE